mmetsp:Transcript_10455/g.20034  ORF Transcript_10455/g.20034 Transcript_10455/m.20034 type:complete len:365 (-) Transcript_10455:142-1236(-)
MGVCASDEAAHHAAEKKDIAGQARQVQHQPMVMKLVLVGPEQSGKSTLMKQLLRIHRGGMDQKKRKNFLEPVNRDIMSSMEILLEKVEKYGANDAKLLYAPDLIGEVKRFREYLDEHAGGTIDASIGVIISNIWKDAGIQRCLHTVNDAEYEINDSACYFFENTFRICRKEYTPSTDDVIRVRSRTTGIYQESFEHDGHTYQLVDLGGQRSERRKWKSCFAKGDVNAVLFLAAISGFNIMVKEDRSITQIEEAYHLFQRFTSEKETSGIAVILFLNKYDIFTEKIKTVDITDCPLLKDFKGDCRDAEEAAVYIEGIFEKVREGKDKQWFCHFTDATNEELMKDVFWDIKEYVLHLSLLRAGLLI